jgi:hypothetical protein
MLFTFQFMNYVTELSSEFKFLLILNGLCVLPCIQRF